MKIEISTVKGFSDYLPPESLKRKAIKEIIEKNFKLYGFLPVETPIIEFDELMRSDATNEDEAISDRFKLKDKGGRNLGLRYEFTFQLARIFKENPNIKLPFKRYQIGPVFRDEPVSSARSRQFTQCDIDIIGDSSISADAECISVFSDILKELEIDAEFEVNNRKLLNSIIESVEINNIKEVIKELDKLDKVGQDTVMAELRRFTSPNQIITLFKLLDKDLSFFKDNVFDGAEELESLIAKCKSYGIKIKFNPTLARGLSYYTGNIFEAKISDSKDSIAGGGRYDDIVGRYLPNKIPAVGFSFGLERLSQLASVELEISPKVIIISFDQEKESISLAKKLRKNSISCSITEGQPSKALDYANSLKIPYIIFLGKEEIDAKKFKLKDMQSGNENLLTEKQLINKLKK